MKTCTRCGTEKPETEFYNQPGGKNGLKSECKECTLAYNAEWRRKHPKRMAVKRRADHYKAKYNMSLAEYDDLLKAHDNSCAICGKSPEENGKRLCVDHDHETGRIRGLLCHSCNKGIGLFQDNPIFIQEAINYLRSH